MSSCEVLIQLTVDVGSIQTYTAALQVDEEGKKRVGQNKPIRNMDRVDPTEKILKEEGHSGILKSQR